MSSVNPVDSAKAFLDEYTAEFDTRDGLRISALYHAPCVTVRGDGSVHCFQSRDEIGCFFGRVADGYAKEGMHAGVYKNFNAVPIGGASVLATVDWEMLREDRTVIRQWRQSYNLIRTSEGWRILCSTIHRP
jgi:hypothetical protein